MAGQFVARIAGLAALFAGSQAPGFTQAYMQNLSGRVDELGAIVRQYDAIASDLETTREGYVDDLRAAGRESTDKTAGVIETTYDRYTALSAQLEALRATDPMRRPIILARSSDREIAASAMEEFRPTVPLTADGFAYALGAGTFVWGALAAIFGIIGGMFGMGRRYA